MRRHRKYLSSVVSLLREMAGKETLEPEQRSSLLVAAKLLDRLSHRLATRDVREFELVLERVFKIVRDTLVRKP